MTKDMWIEQQVEDGKILDEFIEEHCMNDISNNSVEFATPADGVCKKMFYRVFVPIVAFYETIPEGDDWLYNDEDDEVIVDWYKSEFREFESRTQAFLELVKEPWEYTWGENNEFRPGTEGTTLEDVEGNRWVWTNGMFERKVR